MKAPSKRAIACVLSARSLPYAEEAFRSLFAHCLEDVSLTLITDGRADKDLITATLVALPIPERHQWIVRDKSECDALAQAYFSRHPNLARFREGHPCWRKITDPLLFTPDGDDVVILDPDLYFPNHFSFEPTPDQGLLLMYQPPSCLLPHETVVQAFELGVPMAHHTDIGVAQIRAPLDLDWLDWFLGGIGGESLPRSMHVESIVWAALAARMGGGHLDPVHWHCWRNSQWKRLARKVGVSGGAILGSERFGEMKCFHGGGVAKWWIPERLRAGKLGEPATISAHRPPLPYELLSRSEYDRMRRWKDAARSIGYYKLMKN